MQPSVRGQNSKARRIHSRPVCHPTSYGTNTVTVLSSKGNGGFPYSLPSVGPGADPGVQAVSPQVTISHPPGCRLPLLSARPAVTFPSAEHHQRPPLGQCHVILLGDRGTTCEQLAECCCAALPRVGFEPTTCLLIASSTLYPLRHRGIFHGAQNLR